MAVGVGAFVSGLVGKIAYDLLVQKVNGKKNNIRDTCVFHSQVFKKTDQLVEQQIKNSVILEEIRDNGKETNKILNRLGKKD